MLDGAKALAIPTRYGQNLIATKTTNKQLVWESYDNKNRLWFKAIFDTDSLKIINSSDTHIAQTLQQLLQQIKTLNPLFKFSFSIKTQLDFPRNWGLGTSSTLINNLAQWSNVNAFKLLQVFGGSGYDIACAKNDTAISYQLIDSQPLIKQISFNPNFKEQLYFVFLNQKQDSKLGIKTYRNKIKDTIAIKDITAITNELILCDKLSHFDYLLKQHEAIIATLIDKKPIQKQLFNDYFGQIKSLGAWGGDFALVTGNDDTPTYFKQKGFNTCLQYQDMVK